MKSKRRRWRGNDAIRKTILSLWDQSVTLRCMRKLIFSPNKACGSRISIYCARCAVDENLQLLVARQWNRDYWSASPAAGVRRLWRNSPSAVPNELRFWSIIENIFFFYATNKAYPSRQLRDAIPFYLKQFNMFSIFNNLHLKGI